MADNLLDKASILLTPTAHDNGKMLSIKPTNGDGDFTFSRNGDGSRVNSSGIIVTEGANLPRINYENGCGSWLLEDESTNILTQSETFSDWLFLGNRTQITINNVNSPDGTQNGAKFERILATGNSVIRFTGLTIGDEYTFSLYAKKGNFDNFSLDISDITTNFTLTDNWVKYEITETATASKGFVDISMSGGVVGSYFYIWGAQLEQQSYATSYIPTSGASSTRLRDLASGSGNSTLINSTEGVLYFEAKTDELNVGSISINDGTLSNRITARFRSDISKIQLSTAGSTDDFNLNSDAITLSDYNKIAIVYNNGDYYFVINGVKGSVQSRGTFSANTFTKLDFNRGGGGEVFFGKVKALAVYKEALTDAELTALTTI